jgi:trk system potassium uptake protein TrkA
MVEFRLTEEGPATSMTLHELSRKYRSKALVCAIRRDGDTVIPDGNTTLKAGDLISFAADPKETELFLKLCGIKSRMPKHVMILGAGMIAYYLLRMMREVGMKSVVIENNSANADTLNQAIPGQLIINADGTDRDILDEEGLSAADAFVALTGTDEVNMLMGMYAHREGVPKVVTKISRSSMLDLVDIERVGSVVCPRDIVASRIISYVRAKENAGGSDVETLYRIAQGTAEALEFVVHEEHGSITGTPLKDLKTRDGIIICAILRKGEVIIPRGDDTIEQGDHVVIATTIKQLSDLSMILH